MARSATMVDLWAEGHREMSALGRSLGDGEATMAVPACPEWKVKDVFAHMAGVAADILGGRIEGVATDGWTARQVAERADRSLAEILDEWDGDAPRLVEALTPRAASVDPRLVIDQWTHEQDVRGALARPGSRAGDRAGWVTAQLQRFFRHQVADAGLAPITVDLLGGPAGEPSDDRIVGRLTVDAFEFARARLGRRSPAQVRAWNWQVDDIDAYAAVVPVFGPRADDLVEAA